MPSQENKDNEKPVATAKEVLDFLVKAGHINYSKPDNVYFYWKDGDLIFLNFRLE
jgi:hypothetical protein